jgi:two-component system sensor histidine kinase DesK
MRLLPKDKDIGLVPYLSLIYVVNVPLTALATKAGPRQWALAILSLLLFLPLYFRGYWVKGRPILWVIASIALLAVVFLPVNAGACVYFIYASAFAGNAADRARAVRIIAALLLAITVETLVLHLPVYFWILTATFTVIIGVVGIHYAERHRENAKLRVVQEEVEQMAQTAERERISRDLHDVLGHTLSVIILKSELASKLADSDPQKAAQEIRDVERISRDALSQVRTTVRGYQSRSLTAEVEQARSALGAAGVQVRCDFDPLNIPVTHEGVLALALREAITNVIRHARATSCYLSLRQDNGACRLEIKDDGCGKLGSEGVGLSGMRTRVEALGGSLQREAESGTRLIITLPMVTP